MKNVILFILTNIGIQNNITNPGEQVKIQTSPKSNIYFGYSLEIRNREKSVSLHFFNFGQRKKIVPTTILFGINVKNGLTGHALGIWICGCSPFYKRELWASKSAGAHSTKSLKISGCKRWYPKDLRVCAMCIHRTRANAFPAQYEHIPLELQNIHIIKNSFHLKLFPQSR